MSGNKRNQCFASMNIQLNRMNKGESVNRVAGDLNVGCRQCLDGKILEYNPFSLTF